MVDGSPCEITSYRKELQVIPGGFLILQRLISPALQHQAKVKLWTDRKLSMERLTNMTRQIPLFNKEALSPEFAISETINKA